jgi:hypothetical protein
MANDISIALFLRAVAYLVFVMAILHLVSFNRQVDEIQRLRGKVKRYEDAFPYYDSL